MKKISVLFLTVLILIFTLGACVDNQVESSKINNSLNLTVEIRCSQEDKYDSIGSGFFIDNKHITTNAHIVIINNYGELLPYEKIVITYKGNEHIGKTVKYDMILDIAIIELEIVNKEAKIKTSEQELNYGDEVYAFGNLNGYGLAYGEGVISAPKTIIKKMQQDQLYIQTNIEVSAGNSGGPLFNYKGQIIGMIAFKLRDNNGEFVDGVSFAIPIERIIDFFKK